MPGWPLTFLVPLMSGILVLTEQPANAPVNFIAQVLELPSQALDFVLLGDGLVRRQVVAGKAGDFGPRYKPAIARLRRAELAVVAEIPDGPHGEAGHFGDLRRGEGETIGGDHQDELPST